MSKGFLAADSHDSQGGVVFGGGWDFPLAVLRNGYVMAKWGYVILPQKEDILIMNCLTQWNVSDNFGFHLGGDIYTRFGGAKLSGVFLGVLIQN